MNNVRAVVLRSAGACLHSSTWSRPCSILLRASQPVILGHPPFTSGVDFTLAPLVFGARSQSRPRNVSRHFSSTALDHIQASPFRHALGRFKPKEEAERGLAFGEKSLTSAEIQDVFGEDALPTNLANRLLRVIHGRRVDGTLDVPLPDDMQELAKTFPWAFESGLQWLRENYYVDEDEAILARIEREESGYDERTPSQLRQRAQDLKLYGPQTGKLDEQRRERSEEQAPEYFGPQSGKYYAKLSEKGDVFGESELEKIRAENEAKAKQEEEELDQQIEEIQAKRVAQAEQERSQALAMRPEQSIESVEEEIRPPNEYERAVLMAKNRATSKLTLDSSEIKDRTLIGRLLPSGLFVVLFCTGCWFLAQHWAAPKRSERLWPDMSLSFATVTAIMAVNTGIFLLWRFPPAWRILNQYFLVVPATPNPLSLFGNIFSHVKAKHFLFNMLPLVVFGPSLHEEMGRGNFLALYFASGVIGSFASLTHHTVRGILYTSSLGASGSVWAITAAFFNVHSDNDFTVFFMPEDWKEHAHIKGWMLFSCLIAIDVLGGIRGKPVTVDYVAHASGALSGWVLAEWFKRKKASFQADGEFTPKTKLPWWQVVLHEGGNQDKGGY